MRFLHDNMRKRVLDVLVSFYLTVDDYHHHHHLFGTLNMVHEVQLVNNNMTEQLNSDPRTLKSLFSL